MTHFAKYPPARTMTVGPGADFASIGAAITAAAASIPAPSTSDPVVIVVAPGGYTEAPFAIPAGVVVAASGPSSVAATITAAGAGITVTMSADAELRGFRMEDGGFAGVTHIRQTAAGTARVVNVTANGGDVGADAAGAGVDLNLDNCSFLRSPGDGLGTAAIRATGGASISGNSVGAIGSPGADVWTTGWLAADAGTVVAGTRWAAVFCGDGMFVDDGALAFASSGLVQSCTNAFHVGATGAAGTLRSFANSVQFSAAFDVLVDGAASSWLDSGSTIDEQKRSIAAGANIIALSVAEDPVTSERAAWVLGEFHVGSEVFPSESAFGGGDSHTRGMAAFLSDVLDAGPFTDVTAVLASASGSTTTVFPTGAVGNAFFIGGDVAFPNFKIDTTTAIALGAGSLVLEYSDGIGGWLPLTICACDSVAPFLSHAEDIFGRVAFEQIRFGDTTGWGAQIINGVSKFWIRISVAGAALGTNPVVESAKLGTDRTEINGSGVLEHFGAAELRKELIMHQRLHDDLVGSSPGNVNILFSANVTLGIQVNNFANGITDGLGAVVTIPDGVDTSRPVRLAVRWIPSVNTAGDVEFETNFVPVQLGDTLDGTLAETLQATVQAVAAGQQDVLREVTFDYDISTLEPGDQFTFSFFRDASAGNPDDTLAGNVEIVSMRMTGVFWR